MRWDAFGYFLVSFGGFFGMFWYLLGYFYGLWDFFFGGLMSYGSYHTMEKTPSKGPEEGSALVNNHCGTRMLPRNGTSPRTNSTRGRWPQELERAQGQSPRAPTSAIFKRADCKGDFLKQKKNHPTTLNIIIENISNSLTYASNQPGIHLP